MRAPSDSHAPLVQAAAGTFPPFTLARRRPGQRLFLRLRIDDGTRIPFEERRGAVHSSVETRRQLLNRWTMSGEGDRGQQDRVESNRPVSDDEKLDRDGRLGYVGRPWAVRIRPRCLVDAGRDETSAWR